MFTLVYLFLNMFTRVYLSLPMFAPVYTCLKHLCLLVFTYVYHSLLVLVNLCLPLFTCVYLFIYVYHCLLVFN